MSQILFNVITNNLAKEIREGLIKLRTKTRAVHIIDNQYIELDIAYMSVNGHAKILISPF